MARGLMVSHSGLAAIFPLNVKFNQGDGIEPKGGLVSGGPRGPEPPTWILERLKTIESP